MPKRFSLRLMLVVVTALCIALGVWGLPAERQRRAVNALRAAGGEVIYFARDPESDTFLRGWIPQDYLDEVAGAWLSLGPARLTDDELAYVKALPKLRYLRLDYALITDEGLVHLDGLTELESLYLDGTQITDAGLLRLHGLTNLQILWLIDTKVTDDGIARLRKALPKCKVFF